MLDDLGQVDVWFEGEAVWGVCRLCNDVISEVWPLKDAAVARADLTVLAQDALDHVCGFGYATD